tara:strand:+ start:229 stop:447 length:219 start_codon:yes stop_codon:yes gene_type:complete
MLKAALSHFVAQRDRTVANLNNLLQNSAGIGEHVDLVGEVIAMVEELERANSCAELLSNMTSSQSPDTKTDE